jgi:hypothetical protein
MQQDGDPGDRHEIDRLPADAVLSQLGIDADASFSCDEALHGT